MTLAQKTPFQIRQVCVQLPTSAVNTALPAFTAERHAAAVGLQRSIDGTNRHT